MESTIAIIIASIIGLNLVLQGVKKGLEQIKDKTATDLDNKIYNVINKIASYGEKLVGLLGNIQKK
jgi:hypothetical protein